jgi:hypothetical protein
MSNRLFAKIKIAFWAKHHWRLKRCLRKIGKNSFRKASQQLKKCVKNASKQQHENKNLKQL